MKAGSSLFALSLVVSTQIALSSESGTWLADNKGCKLWDSNPQPDETVTWTGACQSGFAEGPGIRQWIVSGKPGSRYEGSFIGGKANGKGTTYFPNGLKIEAEFANNNTVGPVVMYFIDGARYEGDFTAGKRTGKGVLTRANGDRYEGDFVDGKWSGRGIFATADGTRYEGNYVDNKKSGKGIYTTAAGISYVGDFADNTFAGKGTYITADGARYEGGWVDGKRSGMGSQVYADGATYSGEWREDEPLNPEALKRKTYGLSSERVGSHLLASNTSNIQVPPEKSYAQLTPEQKRKLKDLYDKMPDADEPPYPLNGVRTILRACEELQRSMLVRGELLMAVSIDAHGNAISVEAFKSPDPKMTKAVASVLMLEKYKPAVCNGSPCQMQFPFRMNFHVEL